MKKLTPVSVLGKVKRYLADGGWVEVVCTEGLAKQGGVLKGSWEFYSVMTQPDGTEHRTPILVWRTMEPKTVSTWAGLGGLAQELGIHLPVMPLNPGEKGVWKRAGVDYSFGSHDTPEAEA